MVVGSIWYGPLFGKKWLKLSGISQADMQKAQKKGMGKTYAIAFVGALLMSYVFAVSHIFASTYLGVSGLAAGFTCAFFTWLGFIAPVTLGPVLWEGKPWKLWALNAGYYLVVLLVISIIITSM